LECALVSWVKDEIALLPLLLALMAFRSLISSVLIKSASDMLLCLFKHLVVVSAVSWK
jgi:hypothetical protein